MDNIAKEQKLTNKIKYFWIAILTVVVILGIYLYVDGYRFTSNLTLGKSGNLIVNIPLPLTSIYIDNSKKIETTTDNETVKIKLSPKAHSIIIGRDGYFPWTKEFVMPSKGEIILNPLFVSQNASGQIITQSDPEYWKIRNQITRDQLPTQDKPKISSDEKYKLWVDDNGVMISNGEKQIKVIEPDTAIRSVSFYKDRNDAIIFSTANSIYAIETDTSGVQNFLPIYRGTRPAFIEMDTSFIYVLDGENLMQIII